MAPHQCVISEGGRDTAPTPLAAICLLPVEPEFLPKTLRFLPGHHDSEQGLVTEEVDALKSLDMTRLGCLSCIVLTIGIILCLSALFLHKNAVGADMLKL